ncbi:unnamed protein product [Effrenium voratum]|uniref:Kinesin motor domain-containing protein n=1 Tax=Effrenium voratum TaxID=2562239 RepID=A0AA36JQM2_9DINO|nr:unnamed protein product [Effrenium voratum]CAJ1431459.1 unnamed protein product [Effrenium voratum]
MGDKASDCVKVAIRCRPPSTKEINNGEESIVEMTEAFGEEGEAGQVVLSDPNAHDEPGKFAFDIVFGLSVAQSQIYESVGRPALQKTFEGYNGTIFAYGQTGSGKSFTMTGAAGDLRGIIPRVNEELFAQIAEKQSSSTCRFLVMCSFFEIYNEIIFDLLNPVADRTKLGGGLQIKEHPVMGIYVKDLTEIVAEDVGKVETLLENGNKSRAVSSTLMNSVSSRSHSIFTIKIHQKDEEDTSRNVFAKLNLVDLAGSERQKGTGASGQTLKEGANINKSLSALGNVINALVETANGKKVFIPYRNSKLTRVLQESLGGNSLCTMLATLSPAACNYEETMSTLRYANRAKAIKVSATKNEEASQVSRLKAEVEELKKKLMGTGAGGAGGSAAEREAEQKFQKQLKEMEHMLSSNWDEKARLSEEHERQMQRFREEREKAAAALEEERLKRLRLLEEKNDLELSLKGLVDLAASVSCAPAVLAESRQWLKSHRALRQDMEALAQQRNLVHVFKHGFEEDLKLWGEGAESEDLTLQITGIGRSLPKLEKLRKAIEKLLQLEGQCVSEAYDLKQQLKKAANDLASFRPSKSLEVEAESEESERQAAEASMEQIARILSLIQKQLQAKLEELGSLTSVEMGQTCEVVLKFSEGLDEGEASSAAAALQALLTSPALAVMPIGMPAKPLREYLPDEVQDTPETTEVVLAQLIRWESVMGKAKKSPAELLARPPPKFLLDVAVAVKAVTGFPAQLEEQWPESREERLARFQQIAEAIRGELSMEALDFDGVDVLKGKEVPKTLRLLQLLALCGARMQPPAPPEATQAPKADQLPRLLDGMDKCIRAAKAVVESRQGAKGGESQEDRLFALEAQLAEESRARLAQEEQLQSAERQLQEVKAALRRISTECQQKESEAEAEGDEELMELERQAAGLTDVSNLSEEGIMELLGSQLEAMQAQLQQGQEELKSLKQKRQEVKKAVQASTAKARRVEAQVQRARQKREADEELIGQSPEEQQQILEARGTELRSKIEDLEAQAAQMASEVEQHRSGNRRLEQEKNELQAKAEDATLQMQILQEERDSLREAMEQLWTEKAQVDEDLEMQMAGYVNLSERLNLQQDENQDLEMQVERKKEEIANLQRNGFH